MDAISLGVRAKRRKINILVNVDEMRPCNGMA